MTVVTPICGKKIYFHLREKDKRFNWLKTELNCASMGDVVRKALLLLHFTLIYRSEGTILYIFNAKQGDVDAVKEIFESSSHRAEIDEATSGAATLVLQISRVALGALGELRGDLSRMFSEISEQGVIVGAIKFLELIVDRCGEGGSILLLRSPKSETRYLDYQDYISSRHD